MANYLNAIKNIFIIRLLKNKYKILLINVA